MLLSIQDLRVAFRMGRVDGVAQRADAVKGVSFDIAENRTVALVGGGAAIAFALFVLFFVQGMTSSVRAKWVAGGFVASAPCATPASAGRDRRPWRSRCR